MYFLHAFFYTVTQYPEQGYIVLNCVSNYFNVVDAAHVKMLLPLRPFSTHRSISDLVQKYF